MCKIYKIINNLTSKYSSNDRQNLVISTHILNIYYIFRLIIQK